MSSDPFRNLSFTEMLEKDFTLEELDANTLAFQSPPTGHPNPPSSSSLTSTTDHTASAASTNHPSGDPFFTEPYPFEDPLSAASLDFPLSPRMLESLGPPATDNMKLDLDPYRESERPTVNKSASSFDTLSWYSHNAPTDGSGTAPNMQNIQGPSLLDSNTWSGVRYQLQQFDSIPSSAGSSNSFPLLGQPVPQHDISLGGGHASSTHLAGANMFVNHTNMGVDNYQHSIPYRTSMTGNIAYGNMTPRPPTFGASSTDRLPLPAYPSCPPFYNMPGHPPFPGFSSTSQPFPGPHLSDPMSFSTPPSRRSLRLAHSSTSTPTRKRVPSYNVHISDSEDDEACEGFSTSNRYKWRRGKQLVPSEELWERIGRSQWRCKYVGPAEPDGCTAVLSSLRNLGRHMRENHARREVEMNLPEAERVAFNSMPEDLLFNHVTCPFEGADLDKCGYYREHNRRWETKTMLRKDKALKEHAVAYHRNKRRKKVIKKEPLSDDEYLR